jgi:hypothetical protein
VNNEAFVSAALIKKVFFSSLLIFVIVGVFFLGIFGYMLTSYEDSSGEQAKTYGNWVAVQYFADGEFTMLTENAPLLTLSETRLEFPGLSAIPVIATEVSWLSETALTAEIDGSAEIVQFELNTHGQLKAMFQKSGTYVLFNKAPTGSGE